PGVNLDLLGTLDWVTGDRQQVGMWGPYQIEPGLYCRARRQADRLGSGAVLYKARDTGYDPERVSNCIHSLLALVDPPPRHKLLPPGYGEASSRTGAGRYPKVLLQPRRAHPAGAEAPGVYQEPGPAPRM